MAKDRNGRTVPKVADVISVTTPEEDAGWVQFGDPIQTTNGAFEAAGRTWTAPSEGSFRFGVFSRELHLGTWDPNRNDPHVKKLTLSVGVLWDQQSNRVWVDTDGDSSFSNQQALGDYAETNDIDCFGHTEGEDDNRIPFAIKIDRERHAAYLSIADSPHGAMVEGALAANNKTGGLFIGAAPGAQVIDAREPASSKRLSLMLTAFARADVDIINNSGRLGVPEDDGREDFERHVVERAVRVYDKPIACYCGAANALHVLDYQSPEMLRRNRQLPPPYDNAINGGVWFTEDGVVNTVLAPSTSLVTESRYIPDALLWEDGRLHTNDTLVRSPAPAGYQIGANPSPTIPVVSGILADLISESKRMHVRFNAARLTQAVLTGAHLVPGFPVSKQGFGLIDADGAWNQLTKMAAADDPRNPSLTTFTVERLQGSVRKKVNGFQADLQEEKGSMPGELWITRLGGYAGGRTYTLRLRGNDGTYSLLDQQMTFVRDRPARVRFSAKVTAGLHVAFLQFIDAKSGVVMQEVPLSIRAPHIPEIIATGVEKYQMTIPPVRSDVRYVQLGEETQAARFVMRIPYDGPPFISMRAIPGFRYGVVNGRFTNSSVIGGEPIDALHHVGPMQEFESLVANSKPGIQEVRWENRGRPEYATPYDPPAPEIPITGTVSVTKYGVTLATGDGCTIRVINRLADIDGKVELYDAKVVSSQLTGEGRHAVLNTQRTLPAHLAQWRVAVSYTSFGSRVADAFLLNCTDPKNGCIVTAQQSLGANGGMLVVDNPKEGDWRIVVRARGRTQSAISYRVVEAKLSPSAIPLQTSNEKHASGATWFISLPAKQSDAQYAGFRIAGSPGKEDQRNGFRIAMTPLTEKAP